MAKNVLWTEVKVWWAVLQSIAVPTLNSDLDLNEDWYVTLSEIVNSLDLNKNKIDWWLF